MNTDGILRKKITDRKISPQSFLRSRRRAVFLDRDGVINKEKDYLYRWEDFEYIPGVIEALQILTNDPSVLVIITTGQSGIGRGKYSECDFQLLTNRMINDLLQKRVTLDGIWYCPHLPPSEAARALPPYNKICNCRKPKTGLIKTAVEYFAQRDLHIDLAQSCVFGDKTADIKFGQNAGCRTVLVETGYGGREDKDRFDVVPDRQASDLLAGVRWWLGQ
jgi:D-glycero-D-manno-heptose 1,7-bisphosphate phosphatase